MKLVADCRPHVPVIDPETNEPTGEFVTPDGEPIVEGIFEPTEHDIVTPQPPDVPETISDRQFFQALASAGLISKEEAIAAVATGAVPSAMEAFFNGMSEEDEFAARMLLQGAVVFHRHHPLVEAFGALQGMTSSEIDDLWRTAAGL
jgi:hypothetical protein